MEMLPNDALFTTPVAQDTIAARQALIAQHFREASSHYINNQVEGLELRPHQPGIFSDMHDFFTETADQLGRSAMMELPPNAGKSTISILASDMAGVGRTIPNQPPLKSLTLVSRRVARQQIIESYQDFAPHINAQQYDSTPGHTTDATVLTYKAIVSMSERRWRDLSASQAIVWLDEVHRAMGPQTSERIKQLMRIARPTVIAMSATPDFDETRTACETFGITRKFNVVTPRQAIEIGISNGVRLYALYTAQETTFASKRNSLTEADLISLAKNPIRNKLLIDLIEGEAAKGHIGLMQCIAGDSSAHARSIAEQASGRKIRDPRTKKMRHLRVEAVGNFRTPYQNDELVKAFKADTIDALTFTKYLTESFDHPMDYLAATCPVTSYVDMAQFTGRGARLHKRLTNIFTIIDKCSSKVPKRLVTPYNIFEEDCINQGTVLLPTPKATPRRPEQKEKDTDTGTIKESDVTPPYSAPQDDENEIGYREPEQEYFPESVRAAMERIAPGTLLNELLIVRTDYEEAPPGYVHLSTLSSVKDGLMTPEGARYFLGSRVNADDKPYFISVNAGKLRQFVLPEADQLIADHYINPRHNVTRMNISGFLNAEGWPQPSFEVFLAAGEDAGAEIKLEREVYLTPGDAKKLLLKLLEIPLADPSCELRLTDIAAAFDFSLSSLHKIAHRDREQSLLSHLYKRRRGEQPGAFRIVEAINLEGAVQLVQEAAASSKIIAARIGTLTVEQVVHNIQTAAQEKFWSRKLRSRISPNAVNTFIDQFLDTGQLNDTFSSSKLSIPPPPLDEGHRLSHYGSSWRQHTACAVGNAVLFFSDNPKDELAAKQICKGCPVKGDCLLFEIQHPTNGIAGGLTEKERLRSLDGKARHWLKIQRPTSL